MKAQISLPYLQAISKIAFHFVLAHFHFTGFESEFEDLKRFIYSGTGASRAQIVEEVILPQLRPEEARLRQWSHILTAEFNPDGFFSDAVFRGTAAQTIRLACRFGLESFSSLAGEGSGATLFLLRPVRSVWIFRWYRRTQVGSKNGHSVVNSEVRLWVEETPVIVEGINGGMKKPFTHCHRAHANGAVPGTLTEHLVEANKKRRSALYSRWWAANGHLQFGSDTQERFAANVRFSFRLLTDEASAFVNDAQE